MFTGEVRFKHASEHFAQLGPHNELIWTNTEGGSHKNTQGALQLIILMLLSRLKIEVHRKIFYQLKSGFVGNFCYWNMSSHLNASGWRYVLNTKLRASYTALEAYKLLLLISVKFCCGFKNHYNPLSCRNYFTVLANGLLTAIWLTQWTHSHLHKQAAHGVTSIIYDSYFILTFPHNGFSSINVHEKIKDALHIAIILFV